MWLQRRCNLGRVPRAKQRCLKSQIWPLDVRCPTPLLQILRILAVFELLIWCLSLFHNLSYSLFSLAFKGQCVKTYAKQIYFATESVVQFGMCIFLKDFVNDFFMVPSSSSTDSTCWFNILKAVKWNSENGEAEREICLLTLEETGRKIDCDSRPGRNVGGWESLL